MLWRLRGEAFVAREGDVLLYWVSFGLLGGVGGPCVDSVSVEWLALGYWKVGILLAEKTRFQRSGPLAALIDVGLLDGAGDGGPRAKVLEKLTAMSDEVKMLGVMGLVFYYHVVKGEGRALWRQ